MKHNDDLPKNAQDVLDEGDTTMCANKFCLKMVFNYAIIASSLLMLFVCSPASQSIEKASPIAIQPTSAVRYESPISSQPTAPFIEVPVPSAIPMPTQFPGLLASPPTPDNFFQNYGLNPFEDPREDHLSTFALDFDTASYTVARRYVMDGNLPSPDAIRVEEFINYFNPEYPHPPDIAFAIYADGAPSPFQTDGSFILRFGVQGYEIREEERKPASLTFVIDISGSMDIENSLGLVKQSLQLLVERLNPSDSVAIVVYGSDAYVVLNPISGEDNQRIFDL